MFHFLLLLIVATLARGQLSPCPGQQSLYHLNFDDVTVIGVPYAAFPSPYKNFNIVRAAQVPQALIMNTSDNTYAYYQQAPTTQPNIIFTPGETLTITYNAATAKEKAFSVISFSIASIFIDQMGVTIQTSKNGNLVSSTTLNLPLSVAVPITVNQNNIDTLTIGCANQDIYACAHMAFDTFVLCH